MAAESTFTTLHTEGALLPVDLLERVVALDKSLGGLTEGDYQVEGGQKLNERISYAFNRALALWSTFSAALERLPEGDVGTTLTRDRWLLPLLSELGWRRLPVAGGIDIEDRRYPVSHEWQARPEDVPVPIHLLGARVDLEARTKGLKGGATRSPHSLMQELLNRSKERLWGFLSNGLRFRVLRDNASLTRQAFVEFDLERMMVERAYNDFKLFWLLCHESRIEAQRTEEMWLEKWSRTAQSEGTRALDRLRVGVQQAIEALGRGFLRHPSNGALREALRNGTLDKRDYYRQLLRMAYRLIFLCVSEDRTYEKDGAQRSLLMRPDASDEACARYRGHYSVRRLREKATRRKGTRHADLYAALRLVMDKLGADDGCPQLGLPALGSFLWARDAVPSLADAELSNVDLLDAVRGLSVTRDGSSRRLVDYRNLGAEELGSVYEFLLELHPRVDVEAAVFELVTAGGSERKTTGSYYTPTSLIDCLLDSALDPVVEEAAKKGEDGILALKVCDPACGSGHFLIAAAHRIAHRLASVRTGDEEPAPSAVRRALRDVISHCIYGVDLNEMAVELCKVSLWMDSLEPGKPLSFLDHRILCGNSLLGTTPALMAKGIPDEAFTPIEGDDKKVCSELKKRNKRDRQGEQNLVGVTTRETDWKSVEQCAVELNVISEDSIDDVQVKAKHFQACARSEAYRRQKLAADAWCAAFVCKKAKNAPELTHDTWRRIASGGEAPADSVAEVERLAEQYRFLHWHLAYPDVFRVSDESTENEQAGWSGGFDAVLGNPPWERVKLQEQEWFAERDPDIAAAATAAVRKRMIAALVESSPQLHEAFLADRRRAEGESHVLRNAGRHPLCGRGDVNTYSVFAETMRIMLGRNGRMGVIVPSGIATDDTTKYFFSGLMDQKSLVCLYDFENEEHLFPAVDHRMRFCILVVGGRQTGVRGADFVFFARQANAVYDPSRRFNLTAEDTRLLNPNTGTCPTFRSSRDAEINKAIYRLVPVLIEEGPPEKNPWGLRFQAMLHMANDSGLFRTSVSLEADGWRLDGNVFVRGSEVRLPLYEAKMVHHFDARFSTYEGQTASQAAMNKLPELDATAHNHPSRVVQPRYWVPEAEVSARLSGRWSREWLMGWRDITNAKNERTLIATVVPRVGVGDKFLLILPSAHGQSAACLVANLDAFVLDYCARQKVGGTSLKFFTMRQLPIISPDVYRDTRWDNAPLDLWMARRVLELVYTSWDLRPFASDCGYDGPPFRWDEARRFLLRCELDAAYFHLYGINRDDVDYIMDTFPIVKRKDEAKHGEYRTKRVILEIYDEMQKAMETGIPYQTRLDPPPADPRVAHPPRAVPAAAQ